LASSSLSSPVHSSFYRRVKSLQEKLDIIYLKRYWSALGQSSRRAIVAEARTLYRVFLGRWLRRFLERLDLASCGFRVLGVAFLVVVSIGLTVWFREKLNIQNRFTKALTENSYGGYLL